MELFVDWSKRDYLEFVITVVIIMGLVFAISIFYNRHQIERLKRLEIPLK